MKRTAFKRSFELAKMALKVGYQEVTSGNLQSRVEQAKVIAESLSHLKGAAMKSGQLLSLELTDYFPPEAIEILSRLQNKAPAIAFSEIEKVLKKDLGAKFKDLKELDATPAASASIGQVHSALLHSQPVALKVQYPGVRDSVDADLKVIRTIAESFCRITGRKMDLDPLFAELKSVLTQETDYLREVHYIGEFAKRLAANPELGARYSVPDVYPEYSSHRVLTMSWEEGLSLTDWLQTKPSKEKREEAAGNFIDLMCLEFFEWGLVQTDPNFANFLIRDRGIVLLDFGATREYTPEFRKQYIRLLQAVGEEKHELAIEEAIAFGLMDKRESKEARELFYEVMKIAVEPFFNGTDEHSYFNFANAEYSKRAQEISVRFSRSLKYSPPPHHLLFLQRKFGGISLLLKRLDVEINVRPYWEKMVKERS